MLEVPCDINVQIGFDVHLRFGGVLTGSDDFASSAPGVENNFLRRGVSNVQTQFIRKIKLPKILSNLIDVLGGNLATNSNSSRHGGDMFDFRILLPHNLLDERALLNR
jgi:hypothetical protein